MIPMQRLQELRKKRGLSQQEFGRLFNLSQQTIWKYESGRTSPNVEMLCEFCKFFDTTVDFLVGADSYGCKEANVNLTREEYYLIQDYRKLSENSRQLFRTMLTRIYVNEVKDPSQ